TSGLFGLASVKFGGAGMADDEVRNPAGARFNESTMTAAVALGRREKRRLRRRDGGAPLAAAAPLLGLALLFVYAWAVFAPVAVERRTEDAARAALAEAGFDWADVRVSGQSVTLVGTPPDAEAEAGALAAVRARSAKALVGAAAPATRVRLEGDDDADGDAQDGGTPEPAAGDLPAPSWTFDKTDGRASLDGVVGDEKTLAAIRGVARAYETAGGVSAVDDALTLDAVAADAGHLDLALRSADIIGRCEAARVAYADGAFNVDCTAPDGAGEAIETLARAPLPVGEFGDVFVSEALEEEPVEGYATAEERAACNEAFEALLTEARIEFKIASAQLDEASAPLLDRVAEAAEACPGRLRIEGHTDATGAGDVNERLSGFRAQAVKTALVDRGLDEALLEARGYGERRPIADNATAEGRARNRRIEIRAVAPDGADDDEAAADETDDAESADEDDAEDEAAGEAAN
ncbi:MAG: OmpA family protein, partial [Pseudomonadota bacterium]